VIARLVLVEVVRARHLWAWAFVIMVLAALVALVCAGDVSTAAVLTDPVDAAGLRNHALVFGGINSIVVVGALNVLVTFTIRVQRRTHALWQFAGVGPALIGRVVLAQAAALSLAAFGTALLVLPVVLQQLMAFLSAPLRSVDAPVLEPRLGLVEGLVAFAVFELTVLLSALGAARAASRTPALFAVRDPELEVNRTGLGRKTTAVVLGVTTVSMYVLNLLGAQGVTMVFLVPAMGFVVTVAPWLCRTLVARWTTALPGAPVSWFLARESLTHHVARSHSAIALLAVALMLGSLTGLAGVWESPSYYLAGFAIFGSPVLIILFTGAATVMMTTMGRRRDAALLVVAGGTFRTAVVSAVLEAFAMVVTALLIALPVALATVPTALSSWTEPLRPLPFVIAIGFVIMLVATVTPVLQARRRSLGRQLVDTGT
jgi:hypothetical protein